MKSTLLLCVAVLAVGASVRPAWAEKADRNKPMHIEADSLRYDDIKQLSIFAGNVVLTKGSMVMRAERIEVHQDSDGYQSGQITGSPTAPAFFRQKREGLDEFIEGESERIEYDGRADTVTFQRSAVLRRLRGSTLADEITGAIIVYENLTDTFRVDGGGAKSPSGAGGRVRAMLTPKPEAPATPAASAPAPALRATTTLGGTPK